MIPFPSHVAPGLAAWADALQQDLRQLAVPQGPTPLWSCSAPDLPPAADHPDQAVKVAETGAIVVSTLIGGVWRWVGALHNASRQILINATGSFQQRMAYDTDVALVDSQIGFDRWRCRVQGASAVFRRDLAPGNYPVNAVQAMRIKQTQVTAGKIGISQVVEYVETISRWNALVSASVYVRPSVATTVRLALLGWTGGINNVGSPVGNYASGAYTTGNFYPASNYTVIGQVALACPAGAWTRVELPNLGVPPGTNHLNFLVVTNAAVPQNVTLDVIGAQLEDGGAVSAFHAADQATDFLRCRRFYQKSYTFYDPPGTAGAAFFERIQTVLQGSSRNAFGSIRFPVEMVKQPWGIAIWNTAGALVGANGSTGGFPGFQAYMGGIDVAYTDPGGGDIIAIHWAADAEL